VAAEYLSASVFVDAEPAEVYPYFTRPDAMGEWMGQHASLDPTPGGEFAVDVNGVAIRGRYVVLEPPHRLVFTWGFSGSDVLPPAASTVEVFLRPAGSGTRVEVVHRGLPEEEAAKHRPGWRHFLDCLAGTVLAGRRQEAQGR
jgi:uncharacterized protein YndB with AHSA1/START domain